ncbi:MAG: hypothetical protein LBH31_05380 [Burkholderiaceae bacterium]|nr:hypothetical protein [Burkholderiaceae bacterium]
MNRPGSAPATTHAAPEESPDDIFLWPDDAQCLRSEWEEGEMAHRSDDFIVVGVDCDEYDQVQEGEISYADLNARKTQSATRQPWELADAEIDSIGCAEPAGLAGNAPVQSSAPRVAERGALASESTGETVRVRTVSRRASGLQR